MNKILTFIGGLIAALAGIFAIFLRGKSIGKAEVKAEENEQTIQDIKKVNDIKDKNATCSADSLRKRMCRDYSKR